MKSDEFELYAKMLYDESGLVITPEKSYLLDSRLSPVAKRWEFENLAAMTAQIAKTPRDPKLVNDIVEAMTTNETSFFRDMKPFNNFENIVMPQLVATKPAGSTVKIWCAACSSGQEPYSLAMIIKEAQAKLGGLKFDIYATDLSHEILDTAKTADYSQFEVQRGMPIQMLMKYFTQHGERWSLNDEIKSMVRFDYFNLLKPFTMPGQFDVIFCRNVLIYFDPQTKTAVLDKIHSKINQNGFLFLGGAETVLGISDKFKPLEGHRGIYVTQNSELSIAAAE